jgi:hypothetical protein
MGDGRKYLRVVAWKRLDQQIGIACLPLAMTRIRAMVTHLAD